MSHTPLEDKLDIAIANAKKLAQMNAEGKCRRENPSTKVHQLVIMLRQLSPDALEAAS